MNPWMRKPDGPGYWYAFGMLTDYRQCGLTGPNYNWKPQMHVLEVVKYGSQLYFDFGENGETCIDSKLLNITWWKRVEIPMPPDTEDGFRP